MRKAAILFILLLAHGAFASLPAYSATSETDSLLTPVLSPPSWYTSDFHSHVLAAGMDGVEVRLPGPEEEATELNCLGYSPPWISTSGASVNAVSAGGCMVYPHGCTMNFIFRDSSSYYIGTAGHCLGSGTVVMQVASRVDPTDTIVVTLAAIGKTSKRVDQGIGRDFGLVKINPGWRVVPGVAGAAGPTGTFCGDPLGQPVIHYGHGYVFAVEQGVAKFGEVIPDLHPVIKFTSTTTGYNWLGYGLPGDSGSPVMNAAGLAVGDLTHGLGVSVAGIGVPIPGVSFGTTTAGIFGVIGNAFSLVTADGRSVDCKSALAGLVDV